MYVCQRIVTLTQLNDALDSMPSKNISSMLNNIMLEMQ